MSSPTYLIVEQQQQPPDNLPELLKELAQEHQLDSYQCRQRLVGRGLSLLSKGHLETLEKISPKLQQAGYSHWLLEPSQPTFVPQRILGLQINQENIVFSCAKKQVVFPKGKTVLAIFAEMSGELVEKSVKQLLSSNAYRGRDNIRHLEEHKIHRTILQGKPLLDLYLLDEQKQIVDAVRVFPGKFDPKGLGERATVSSKQNLDQVLQLTKKNAGEFYLHTDFGLVNLPGCTLRRDNPDNPETERRNQISLARFGWLIADLHRTTPVTPQKSEATDGNLSGAISAALLMQNPALAASGQTDDILPLAKELENAAGENHSIKTPSPKTSEEGLPAPPDIARKKSWTHPGYWLGSAGAIVVFLAMILLETDPRLIREFFHYAFSSGIVQLLFATLFLSNGFYCLRLKRQIENTPTSRVRSIAMGMVEVKGRAIRKYALLSPLSNTPCAFYRLTKYRRRDNDRQWTVSSISCSDNAPFYLEDDTGRVEIDPTGCRVSAGTKQEGTPGQIGLIHNSGDSDVKWVEEIIVEGTLLYVLGFATIKKATGPSMAERKLAALRELKSNPQDLKQFDTDDDGKISADEWDKAREAVAEKVLKEELQKQQQRKKQEEHVVIGKKKGRPLVIAETHSEQHLTRRYLTYTLALFVATVAASGWGIYSLLNYLN